MTLVLAFTGNSLARFVSPGWLIRRILQVCLYQSLVLVLGEVGRDLQQFSPHPLAARWQRGLADQLAAWAEREDEVFGPPVTPVPAPHPDQGGSSTPQ